MLLHHGAFSIAYLAQIARPWQLTYFVLPGCRRAQVMVEFCMTNLLQTPSVVSSQLSDWEKKAARQILSSAGNMGVNSPVLQSSPDGLRKKEEATLKKLQALLLGDT